MTLNNDTKRKGKTRYVIKKIFFNFGTQKAYMWCI